MHNVQSRRGIAVEARRPGVVLLTLASAALVLDQMTKVAVRERFEPSETLPIIENVFHLTYVRNTGAAFGLMPGQQSLFVFTTLLILSGIGVFWWRTRPRSLVLAASLGLIVGGALGNLIDRVTLGRVTDFFDFRIWPVFNVADAALVVGAIGLFVWALFAPIGDEGLSASGGGQDAEDGLIGAESRGDGAHEE